MISSQQPRQFDFSTTEGQKAFYGSTPEIQQASIGQAENELADMKKSAAATEVTAIFWKRKKEA